MHTIEVKSPSHLDHNVMFIKMHHSLSCPYSVLFEVPRRLKYYSLVQNFFNRTVLFLKTETL